MVRGRGEGRGWLKGRGKGVYGRIRDFTSFL
jgi:hypothetical protein